MKKTLHHTLSALLLAAAATFVATPAGAQIVNTTIDGYINSWIDIKVVPAGSGNKVAATVNEGGIKLWRDSVSFNQTIPVYKVMGVDVAAFLLYAQPSTAGGYIFAGWYIDDGDGVFDIEKDTFESDETEFYLMTAVDDNATVYSTEAQAKNGPKPSKVEGTVFAYYTRGASVGIAYYQDDADMHANAGTIWVSKKANEPGDQLTVRAAPTDGYQFEYWADAYQLGKPVSRENPYTFTVQGGEKLYAYFTAIDAPEFDFPAEGGYKVFQTSDVWVLSDESLLNGAAVHVLEAEDLTATDDGKFYLDAAKEDAHYETTQWQGLPTILYGKGKVRMAFKVQYGFARKMENSALVRWSGANGTTVKGDVIYVYAFIPELGAFIEIGNTDFDFGTNPTATVRVPANVAYFSMSAYDITSLPYYDKASSPDIPSVIGLSPESFDAGVAGRESALAVLASVEGVRSGVSTIRGQKVYTLSGVEVQHTAQPGVYIVGGKKVSVK